LSKIPDIYDCIKYDVLHNPGVLFDNLGEADKGTVTADKTGNGEENEMKAKGGMGKGAKDVGEEGAGREATEGRGWCKQKALELFALAGTLASCVVPQEYGMTALEKSAIGSKVSRLLIDSTAITNRLNRREDIRLQVQ
jgi:hypothetical protein